MTVIETQVERTVNSANVDTQSVESPRSIDVSPAARKLASRHRRQFVLGLLIGGALSVLLIPATALMGHLGILIGGVIGERTASAGLEALK